MLVDSIHFYRVKDMNRVKVFYEEILGLTLAVNQGECRIYSIGTYGKVGFCTCFPEDFSHGECITFVYDDPKDIDEMYEHLSHHHVKMLTMPKKHTTYQLYHFFAEDFNGLRLEFQVFL